MLYFTVIILFAVLISLFQALSCHVIVSDIARLTMGCSWSAPV